jgi:hypothetical protein
VPSAGCGEWLEVTGSLPCLSIVEDDGRDDDQTDQRRRHIATPTTLSPLRRTEMSGRRGPSRPGPLPSRSWCRPESPPRWANSQPLPTMGSAQPRRHDDPAQAARAPATTWSELPPGRVDAERHLVALIEMM